MIFDSRIWSFDSRTLAFVSKFFQSKSIIKPKTFDSKVFNFDFNKIIHSRTNVHTSNSISKSNTFYTQGSDFLFLAFFKSSIRFWPSNVEINFDSKQFSIFNKLFRFQLATLLASKLDIQSPFNCSLWKLIIRYSSQNQDITTSSDFNPENSTFSIILSVTTPIKFEIPSSSNLDIEFWFSSLRIRPQSLRYKHHQSIVEKHTP